MEFDTYVSGLVAEVLDGVCVDRRSAVTGVRPPRQLSARLRHVGDARLGRRTGKRGRLGGAAKDDRRIGWRFHHQGGAPSRLASLARRFARVPASVHLPKICSHNYINYK